MQSGFIATCASLVILFTCCIASAFAATVNIYDNARVLNAGQVRSVASRLQYPIDIYTTDTFTGSNADFGQMVNSKMRGNGIILAVDTVNRYVWINGRGVPLSRNQYQNAANSFANEFRNTNNYTSATNTAVRSLQSSLVNAGPFPQERGTGVVPGPINSGFNLGSTACCVGLFVLAALAIFGITRARRGGLPGGFGRLAGFRGGAPQGPYNQPYGQGNYPPGYGPGNAPQGQGMNPLAAGGLGAAAGGLLGYELGKHAGERGEQESGYGGDYGGGGAGTDFGGGGYGEEGAGADFGGGDYGEGGAGTDFGEGDYGGGGADFGEGNDGGSDNF